MKNHFILKIALIAFLFFNCNIEINAQGNKKPIPKKPGTGTAAVKKPNAGSPSPINNPATMVKKPGFDPSQVGRAPGSYAIKVKLKGFKNTAIYLADNFGDKQYYRDTCFLDANGVGTFRGNPKLQRGLYMIVFPNAAGYYELPITDDQDFYFEADTTLDESKIKITGSEENESFVAYQNIRRVYGEKRYNLERNYKDAKEAGDQNTITSLKREIDTLEAQDTRYREGYARQYPNYYLTKLFTAFKQIIVPKPTDSNDSMFEYRYYKNHFWDNVDFSEDGLIRAPQGLLVMKLNDFIDKVTLQDPDSLTNAVSYIINKTRPYTETQKYFVQYLTNKFQDRKIMCQDNVTIHMINNFYCTGKAWWYNDTAELRKMCEEGKKAIPTMCGRTAPDLNMSDTAGKMHRLYENLGKNLTILFFYDPTCGHCKEVIPVVNAVFQKHKLNGITVYAVSTENKYEEWREMMRKRPELNEWINVCKTDRYYPWPINKYDYNIIANPTLFVLDNNAKIIGKKIDEHQLEFFIESLLFEKGIIKDKPVPPSDKKEESSKVESKDTH